MFIYKATNGQKNRDRIYIGPPYGRGNLAPDLKEEVDSVWLLAHLKPAPLWFKSGLERCRFHKELGTFTWQG